MTGIICAMQIEADGIIALSQNTQTEEIAGMKFTTGTLNGKDIAVVVCGVGKVNAAMCAVVLLEQVRTIDKQRLKEKVCHMGDDILKKVDIALKISLDLY